VTFCAPDATLLSPAAHKASGKTRTGIPNNGKRAPLGARIPQPRTTSDLPRSLIMFGGRSFWHRLSRAIVAGFVASIVLVASVGEARAQGMMGGGRFLDPPVDSKEIDSLVKMMALDTDTESAVRDLFSAFQGQFDSARAKLQEIFRLAQEEAQRNQDQSVWLDAQKKAIEYYGHQMKLRDVLFEDIKLLLSSEQTEKWPAFERLHRRSHLLDTGQNIIPGSSVDLFRLLDDTKKDAADETAPEVTDTLTRYEIELDRLLIESRDLQNAQLEKTQKMMEEGGNFMANMGEWEKMFDEGRALQVKIREVNTKYGRQIAGMLPDDRRAEFDAEFNRRANPRVYAKNYVDGAFETASGLESLTPEQKTELTTIHEEYEREAAPIRAKWDELLVDFQTKVKLMEMFSGAQGNAEAKAQEQAKKELDERYYTRIRSILTEEQVQALPERDKTNWREGPAFEGN
jgi:hypothetical protein